MAGRGCLHYVHLVSSAVGVLLGLSASIAFGAVYGALVASVLAFISAVFAGLCLFLHVLHHRNVLHEWYSADTLNGLRLLSVFVFNAFFAATVCFIFDAVYYHKAVLPIEDSVYIAGVWSFMTGKWGLLLWFSTKRYSRMLRSDSESDPLLESTIYDNLFGCCCYRE